MVACPARCCARLEAALSVSIGLLVHQAKKILPVFSVRDRSRLIAHLLGVDISESERNFLEASDLETLPRFHDLHEIGGLQKGVGRAGIEPGNSASDPLHMELAALEISPVEIGDLQLPARRRPQP